MSKKSDSLVQNLSALNNSLWVSDDIIESGFLNGNPQEGYMNHEYGSYGAVSTESERFFINDDPSGSSFKLSAKSFELTACSEPGCNNSNEIFFVLEVDDAEFITRNDAGEERDISIVKMIIKGRLIDIDKYEGIWEVVSVNPGGGECPINGGDKGDWGTGGAA